MKKPLKSPKPKAKPHKPEKIWVNVTRYDDLYAYRSIKEAEESAGTIRTALLECVVKKRHRV